MAYWKDIDLELTKAQDGDISVDEDIEAIKNSIRNIVGTIQGSRVMLPSFANNAYNMLFEPLNDETGNRLASAIWDAITNWDNRVTIEGMTVFTDYDNLLYNITITISIRSITRTPEKITVILKQQ